MLRHHTQTVVRNPKTIIKMNIMTIIKSISLVLFFILLNIFYVKAQIPEDPEDISPLHIGEKLPDIYLIDDFVEIL